MKVYLTYLILIVSCTLVNAQYIFEGTIVDEHLNNDVYLSVIEDYRTLNNINNELIISKVTTDDSGYFKFSGNQLENEHRIYKLHIDNCDSTTKVSNHFEGHCDESKSILFIAKNTDSISFPLSFDDQVFCDVKSTNPKSLAFIKIDILLEDMKFDYADFDSKASRDLNNKKWFKELQDYGQTLNEPLAELYIYSFLSDRSKPFHNYYLQDVNSNAYYQDLLDRLKTTYPNSSYTKQYEMELSMSQFEQELTKKTVAFNYTYLLIGLLLLSIGLNFWFLFKSKKQKSDAQDKALNQLTKQEQNVLELMLENHSNKAIAETLFVSLSTIKSHINNIYKKLNINSRDELKELFIK